MVIRVQCSYIYNIIESTFNQENSLKLTFCISFRQQVCYNNINFLYTFNLFAQNFIASSFVKYFIEKGLCILFPKFALWNATLLSMFVCFVCTFALACKPCSSVWENTDAWEILTAVVSVQFSGSVMSYSLQPYGLQHARLPCPSQIPGACSNSYPSSQWCHTTISSSVIPFCLQSFPASGSFRVSQFFTSGGQSIRVSASVTVLPMNIRVWFPLGLTGWIFLHSNGFSRVLSNTTVQKHWFFGTKLCL